MDASLFKNSVRVLPTVNDAESQTITFMFGAAGNKIEPWGKNWVRRDKQLAEFVETEPYLKSTIYSIATSRAALSWELDGPPKTVKKIKEILEHSDLGNGWISLMLKVGIDLLHFDNGAFIEIVREKPPRGSSRKPESMPVLGLVHLASNRCFRTGNPLTPVVYMDSDGKLHKLEWYQVMTLEEMPMPFEDQRNRQWSFVTRVLQGAQVIAEIARYKEEKVSGRFSRALHIVGGVAKHEIDNSKNMAQIDANNAGLMRYMEPVIMASLDPNAKVSHVQIDLATLPDSFDEDIAMKWYITLLALAAGGDFQDLAPLPGGNLGTASQSEILHRKSRAKGTQLWMKLIEHKLKVHKVLPRNVSFRYSVADAGAEMEKANIAQVRANTRETQIRSQEITPEVARQMAVDEGDIKQEHLILLDPNPVETVTVHDDEEVAQSLLNPPKNPPQITAPEDQAPDPLTVEDDTRVPPVVAAKAAKWWTNIIRQSPLQAAAPIDEYKLKIFEQSLRNQLTTRTKFGTSVGWMSEKLIYAAEESGIPALALRHRLPDEYFVSMGTTQIVDSKGSVIYKVPRKVTKTVSHFCDVCDAENPGLYYVPFQGFKWLCDNDKKGLALADKSVKSVSQAMQNLNERYYGDRIVAALMAAYEIGLGHPANFTHITPRLEKELHTLKVLKNQPELLTFAINKWYLYGAKKALQS